MLRPRLYLLAAAVLWSTAGAAVKLSTLSAYQIASGRSRSSSGDRSST